MWPPPFLDFLEYQGVDDFSNESFLLEPESGVALPLSPLVFWDFCNKHPDVDIGHCYMFDKNENEDSFSFKAVGYPCVREISITSKEYGPLAEELFKCKNRDQKISLRQTGALKRRQEE